MKKRVFIWVLVIVVSMSLFAGCGTKTDDTSMLYQISTLQALIVGAYDGEITAKQLVEHGDTGLGTFDDLDGEMIVIDGKVYKATTDGKVSVVPDDETIPFANVAYLNTNDTTDISFEGGYDGLKSSLNQLFPQENMPVLFCISGDFVNIEYRSVPAQEKPYPPLTDVVKDQAVFHKDTISGTLVGFRFPDYMGDMNAKGFHLHFISEDKNDGGHLLSVDSGSMRVQAQTLDEYLVVFPDNIKDIDMSGSSDDAVEAVEK